MIEYIEQMTYAVGSYTKIHVLMHINNNIWHLHSLQIDESHGYV